MLDLGASSGSFEATDIRAKVVRVDLEPAADKRGGMYVRADAARLPFRDRCFDVIVANHSLEHFHSLFPSICEMGRLLKAGGCIFVSVPDASTLSDRIYRWLGKGGGHVNPFRRESELSDLISGVAKVPLRATILLHTGLSFMNRENLRVVQKKLRLLGGGREAMLRFVTLGFRWADGVCGSRLSMYGWAYYFGTYQPTNTFARTNVCVRCGAGHSASRLIREGLYRTALRLAAYRCPSCQTENFFTDDRS